MPSSRKSRTASSNSRTIPNGGLGGCIELRGESSGTLAKLEHENDDKKAQKKPTSINIAKVGDHFKARVSPSSTPERFYSRTPKTPNYPRSLSSPLIANNDNNVSTPFDLWDRCKDNPWLATTPRKDTFLPTMNVRRQTVPFELAGSLLLPSQGFAQSNPPSTPSLASKPGRQSSSSDLSGSPPSLTHSRRSTPESLLTPFSSPRLQTRLPEALSIKPILPGNNTSLASLTIEQLLNVFPTLGAQDLMQSWITSIGKELVKLRVFASKLDHKDPTHLAALYPFCEEVLFVLRQVNVMCEKHTAENRKAQESTDPNGDCDTVKTMYAYSKMQRVTNSVSSKSKSRNFELQEIGDIQATILQGIQVISDVVRNQLAFRIHRLCGGLSEDAVRPLRNFDRSNTAVRYTTNPGTDSITAKAAEMKTTNASPTQKPVGDKNGIEHDTERLRSHRPSIEPIDTSNLDVREAQAKSTHKGLEEIIDSHFDLEDNTTTEAQITGLMTPHTEESEEIFRPSTQSSYPQPQQQQQQQLNYGRASRPTGNSLKSQSSVSSPVSPPTPIVSPFPAPPSYSPPLPPPPHPRPTTTHRQQHISTPSSSSQCQSINNDETVTLHHQIRDLNIKNQDLQGDIKVLLRQLDYLRIGLATPTQGIGGRTKTSRFTFPGRGSGMKTRQNTGLGLDVAEVNRG